MLFVKQGMQLNPRSITANPRRLSVLVGVISWNRYRDSQKTLFNDKYFRDGYG